MDKERLQMERFSDKELSRMFAEFVELKTQFHVHLEDFKQHAAEERQTYQDILSAQRENTAAIHSLTVALTNHVDRSDTALTAWESVTGTVKVIHVIGKVVLFVAAVGGTVGFWSYLKDFFSNTPTG